jgi:hypothetical protein
MKARVIFCGTLTFLHLIGMLASNGRVFGAELEPHREHRDRKIIEAVLLKVLSDTNFDLSLGRDRKRQPTIVLDPSLADTKPSGESLERQTEGKVDQLLINAMVNRNETNKLRFSFRGVPFDERIIIEKPRAGYAGPSAWSRFHEQFPTGKGALAFHLPGYSDDGRSAFVSAIAGPWPHGGMIMAHLQFSGGAWTVTWYKTVLFS